MKYKESVIILGLSFVLVLRLGSGYISHVTRVMGGLPKDYVM